MHNLQPLPQGPWGAMPFLEAYLMPFLSDHKFWRTTSPPLTYIPPSNRQIKILR